MGIGSEEKVATANRLELASGIPSLQATGLETLESAEEVIRALLAAGGKVSGLRVLAAEYIINLNCRKLMGGSQDVGAPCKIPTP